MKAIIARRPGGIEVLEYADIPLPEPGPAEVRVRIRAAGINHLDLWVREGGSGSSLPIVLGCEGAGVVDAVGDGVVDPTVGDHVVTAPGIGCGACLACQTGRESFCSSYSMLGYQRDGTYAEAVVLPATCALPKPINLSWEEAGAFPLTALTAWHMIFDRGRLRSGETVLVMAAGSGVGQAAVQIARESGARVLATASSSHKRQKAIELGAHHAIDYTQDDWHREMRHLTEGRGVDVIIDHTGTDFWVSMMKCLSIGGRVVLCGATSGYRAQIDLRFLFSRQQQVIGSYMGSRGELQQALRFAQNGRLRPVVDGSFPLENAAAAHERLASREQFGKLVLLP